MGSTSSAGTRQQSMGCAAGSVGRSRLGQGQPPSSQQQQQQQIQQGISQQGDHQQQQQQQQLSAALQGQVLGLGTGQLLQVQQQGPKLPVKLSYYVRLLVNGRLVGTSEVLQLRDDFTLAFRDVFRWGATLGNGCVAWCTKRCQRCSRCTRLGHAWASLRYVMPGDMPCAKTSRCLAGSSLYALHAGAQAAAVCGPRAACQGCPDPLVWTHAGRKAAARSRQVSVGRVFPAPTPALLAVSTSPIVLEGAYSNRW
jgi:hypothetical protein